MGRPCLRVSLAAGLGQQLDKLDKPLLCLVCSTGSVLSSCLFLDSELKF